MDRPDNFEVERVFTSPAQQDCQEMRFVLQAVGIKSKVQQGPEGFDLLVPEPQADQALHELQAYIDENPMTQAAPQAPRVYGYAWAGVGVYCILLVGVHLSLAMAADPDLADRVSMRAGDVLHGEFYRLVTALTVHVDGVHLISNLGFGLLFGVLAGKAVGGGVAWLLIVLGGSLGNLLNAFMRPAEHVSVGASTGVFAALGILVACGLLLQRPTRTGWRGRLLPLIAGMLLLAYTGIGNERTDVLAHVTGFVSGLVLAALACKFAVQWLDRANVQILAGLLALGLIALAWSVALRKGPAAEVSRASTTPLMVSPDHSHALRTDAARASVSFVPPVLRVLEP